MTITRIGGFAGFHDVLVVTRDGQMSFTRRGLPVRHCQLRPVVVRRLRTAASRVPWALLGRSDTRPAFPDDMVIMVRSAGGVPVRLENPRLGAARIVFQDLLSGAATAPRLCKALA